MAHGSVVGVFGVTGTVLVGVIGGVLVIAGTVGVTGVAVKHGVAACNKGRCKRTLLPKPPGREIGTVAVGVCVAVSVGSWVAGSATVADGVSVAVSVGSAVAGKTAVTDGVSVAVRVGSAVAGKTAVTDGVSVAVGSAVLGGATVPEIVAVGVVIAVRVGMSVGPSVGYAVGTKHGSAVGALVAGGYATVGTVLVGRLLVAVAFGSSVGRG